MEDAIVEQLAETLVLCSGLEKGPFAQGSFLCWNILYREFRGVRSFNILPEVIRRDYCIEMN